MYGFEPYHILIAVTGAALLLSYWLPRLILSRPPAASAALMLFGMLGTALFPQTFAGLDPISSPKLWEVTAELVVIIVLFSTGLRIELPAFATVREGETLCIHVGLSRKGQSLANRRHMMPARVVWVRRCGSRPGRPGTIEAGVEFSSSISALLDAA